MRLPRLALVALCAGCAAKPPQEQSEWERRNLQSQPPAEETIAPPAYPAAANLVEFRVIDAGGFRYFIDRASLSTSKEGVVRYVLVAQSSEGVQNVTYEAMRCAAAEQRVLAVGHADGSWVAARGDWRRIATPRYLTLYREFFCPQNEPIRTAAEGVRALEQGAPGPTR